MLEHDYELSVGDTIQIGEQIVTVIDIDGPDVSFRVENGRETVDAASDPGLRIAVPR